MPALSCAVPCAFLLSCFSEREEWPTTSVFGDLERRNTRVFRRYSLRNVPIRAEAFPWCYFVPAATLPKTVEWIPVPSSQQIALHIGEHGSVFTRSPSLRNPYTIQFSKYYGEYIILKKFFNMIACKRARKMRLHQRLQIDIKDTLRIWKVLARNIDTC
jgi:hypothetical protein